MDLESLGGGAGAGIIGTIFAAFGINKKVNKLEENKVDKEICNIMHKNIDDKFKILIDGQKEVREDIKSLSDYVRNQR